MEEKTYKNNIDNDAMAYDFSIDDILDEFRTGAAPRYFGEENIAERSKRIVMDAFEENAGHSSISSIEEIIDESMADIFPEQEQSEEASDVGAVSEASYEESYGDALAEDYESFADDYVSEEKELSEYEIRALVDSDEREMYASADIDFELGDEISGEEPPVVSKGERRGKKGSKARRGAKKASVSPIVALLALMTDKRSRRVKADGQIPTVADEDFASPEMSASDAAKHYSEQVKNIRFRAKAATAVCILMLYFTFAAYSFLPLFGAMKGPVGASLTLLIMLLTVMICGLDVFVAGIINLFRGHPGYETLVSLSCVAALADAAIMVSSRSAAMGLPFCAVAASSMCFSIWGSYFTCKGMRNSFRVARSKDAVGVGAEQGISGKGTALCKKQGGIKGFIRRSEQADLAEYIYGILSPLLIIAALVFSALTAFVRNGSDTFVHSLSTMLACAAVFSGGICFAHPFSVVSNKLFGVGAALSGWPGIRDVGKSRGVVISDKDIFPNDSVSISGIRVLQNTDADKVISYTGSVIAASASGLSAPFTDLIKRNGYVLCRVENFAPHDGGGLTAVVNGENVMVGNSGFMNLMGIRVPQRLANRNTVFTAISGELSGLFDIDYKPLPSVQDALGVLLRSKCDVIFALRDFNMTPDALRNKFHVNGEGFNLPSYPERFRISGIEASADLPVSAVISKEGMVPVAEVSKRGKNLYFAVMVSVAIAAAGSVIGLLGMFFAAWLGAFGPANAALAALIMLLWLIPNVLIGLWLQR
ncbi:MAG: hypothetical protein E7420_07835 [Ruminococcaceae bacterium]|nr:hypothetical protein [Oscillospiraceae bacterium]